MRRIGLTEYDESLCSRLYAGNTLSQHVLQASVLEMEQMLKLPKSLHRQVCLRIDAGFGIDKNIEWVLNRGYQLLAKGLSGSRAASWARSVPQWQEIDLQRRWIGLPERQLCFSQPTRTIAVRWLDSAARIKHGLYIVTDCQSPIAELAHLYDLRGGFETDIREDKQGLLLTHRRKRHWEAQETLVLLNDLAHNFLVMFRNKVLAGTPLARFGIYRIIQDLLCIPGHAILDDAGQLKQLDLLSTHPHAAILAQNLPLLWR